MSNYSNLNNIPSVNLHLWEPCNMKCGFCFATFKDVKSTVLPKGHLPKQDMIKVVEALCSSGCFKKINFAGGEPTLCPWLYELVEIVNAYGLSASLITNGSRITESFLKKYSGLFDWIGLSIDSLDPEINQKTGRKLSSTFGVLNREYYTFLCRSIKKFGFRLKVNTVVNSMNKHEDLSPFIEEMEVERWKVLQVLPISEQNDEHVNQFIISRQDYNDYVDRNFTPPLNTIAIQESNEIIKGSYVMVGPAGRFFDNVQGKHQYSKPILQVGVEEALNQITQDVVKFKLRDGFGAL